MQGHFKMVGYVYFLPSSPITTYVLFFLTTDFDENVLGGISNELRCFIMLS
jgi:hypothetical protein